MIELMIYSDDNKLKVKKRLKGNDHGIKREINRTGNITKTS